MLSDRIEALRRQHQAAEDMAAAIVAAAGAYRDDYDAIRIARLIGKLNALLAASISPMRIRYSTR